MKGIKNYIVLSIICCSLITSITAYAQRTSARVTVSPSEIQIGEQAAVNLEIIAPKGRSIILPSYADTLIAGIEVLRALSPDTIIAEEVMTIKQQYIITSFDSLLYFVPGLEVIDGTDTIKTNSFGIKVISPVLKDSTLAYLAQMQAQQTDSIDFEKMALPDIKDNMEPPFVWQDYLQYIWVVLAILALLALIGAGLYMAFRKKEKGYYFKPKSILPPHVIALQALDKIKAEKIWQQGKEKQFYTDLTDILREYIEKRFGIRAFEKTSDEILQTIKIFEQADSSTESLVQVLKLADLVKFAKYTPLPNENDLSLVNSFLFVNQTKIEPPTPEESNNEEEHWQNNETSDNEDNQSQDIDFNKANRK
ncbi:hypothetical protein D0T53_00175 [Dysgonomonas sp. 216]|uniref:hypothetical protein n=1 Tax=Dysgonomonas sp. 216 TaxID=2302934 RepID=UPI0013D0E15A|nr:hypothetical protein [Dysgonomonas sp. 216]NDW17329.1 hypothetical protein [Dysgonomonas sp. 216]